MNGGRFDFDDGGTYCGGWEDGKAHGHGVCTGPKGQGEYSGAWHYGFEVSGVYTWPSGNCYEGQWQNGKRHGLGDERRGRWIYRGEWTQGYKGRYGLRQSTNSQAKYEGTWANGLQDGYGTETYADGGTYQGQWLRGMRHGYGTRRSAPYGVAAKYRSRSHAHASLTSLRSDQGDVGDTSAPSGHDGKEKSKVEDSSRGGFVLRARSEPPTRRRSLSERSIAVKRTILQGLRIKKQRSTGDINQRVAGTGETPRSIRSSGSTASCASDESGTTGYGHGGGGGHHHRSGGDDHGSFIAVEEFVDPNATETYMGEWKNDKRSGFGVSERSDGLKYEGEWFNNKKFGYGVTTFKDGTKEEGKYKNNILVTSQRKKNLLFVRSSKLRERIDSAVSAATRAAQIAVQKADIAISRSSTARDRAEQADLAAIAAREDSDMARICAKQFAPDFHQPGAEFLKKRQPIEPHQPMIGNHVMAGGGGGKSGARSMSMYIPKHTTTGVNYVGGSTAAVSSEFQHDPQQQGIVGSSANSPMFTTPEEQPGLSSNQQQQQHRIQKQLTFEEQASLASGGGGGGAGGDTVQNDSSVVATIHEATNYDPFVRLSDVTMQNVTVRQHSPVATTSYYPSQQHQQHQQRQDPHYQQRLIRQQTDVPGDYYLPQSTASTMDPSRQIRYGNSPMVGGHTVAPGGRQSPTISRTPSQSSSRYSLNQTLYDHFDQYSMAANPKAAKLAHANIVRRQDQPSPNRTAGSPLDGSASAGLTRRTTLASSTDWKGLPPYLDPSTMAMASGGGGEGTSGTQPGGGGHTSTYGPYSVDVVRRPAALKLFSSRSGGAGGEFSMGENPRGSMPDIAELEKTPVQQVMSREEVARLSSHRRQELQRMQEEAELLRNNPFRYLRYLFHPSVRAWFVRWKLPLLILFVNFFLSMMFYRLLTYSKEDDEGGGGGASETSGGGSGGGGSDGASHAS